MKTILQLTCFGLFLFAVSCKESDSALQQQVNTLNPCPTDIICTEVFESLILNVRDQHGRAVKLDKIVSARSNGQAFEFKPEPWMGSDTSGNYAFWTDAQLKQTNKSGETIVVKGFKDEQEVFATQFTVGHDCCHIVFKGGQLNLVVRVPE